MEIDVKKLTFRDATKEEKKQIFWLMNLRSVIYLIVAILFLALGFLAPFIFPARMPWLTFAGLGIMSIALIYFSVTEIPARKCRICKGTVTNKREVSASEETGLYYNAVTFTSEKGEILDDVAVYSDKTYAFLEEGSPATIVCYNKRTPVLFADKQFQKK